jgi:hypothetical protein
MRCLGGYHFVFDTGPRLDLCYAALPLDNGARAYPPYAPYRNAKGLCGAMLKARGGRGAGTVFVTLPESGPSGVVQLCPDVHAVDSGTKEQEEGRDGGVWSAGPGARTSQHRAGNAPMRRSGAARDGPQQCATAARLQEDVKRSTRGVTGCVAWASSDLYI